MVLRSLDGPFFAGLSEKRVLNVSKIGVLLTRCFAEEPCVVFQKKKPPNPSYKGEEIGPVLDSPSPELAATFARSGRLLQPLDTVSDPGFGSERKTMRPGLAALNLLITDGLNFT